MKNCKILPKYGQIYAENKFSQFFEEVQKLKKVTVKLELYDEWYEELKKEYELTKTVLCGKFHFGDTFEEFIAHIVANLLNRQDIKSIIDTYVGRSEKSKEDSCEKQVTLSEDKQDL